jgi:branched-subunit amino acid aminotransferase/4-amino-4-deoxychorismate lyase
MTFFQGRWHEGNVPIMGPRTHGLWLANVFDGARAFEGVTPDLDRHYARVNQSAVNFGLKPIVDLDTWLGLAHEGIARFPANAELYIRPMYWPRNGIGAASSSITGAFVSMRRRSQSQRDHAVTIPQVDRRMRAGRRQGRLSLSELFARVDRGRFARLPELPDAGTCSAT